MACREVRLWVVLVVRVEEREQDRLLARPEIAQVARVEEWAQGRSSAQPGAVPV
jgi:hypothetical protein